VSLLDSKTGTREGRYGRGSREVKEHVIIVHFGGLVWFFSTRSHKKSEGGLRGARLVCRRGKGRDEPVRLPPRGNPRLGDNKQDPATIRGRSDLGSGSGTPMLYRAQGVRE